jgi:hypothetical protein
MTDLNYLIAVSVFPVSAAIVGAIVLLVALRDDRTARNHRNSAK